MWHTQSCSFRMEKFQSDMSGLWGKCKRAEHSPAETTAFTNSAVSGTTRWHVSESEIETVQIMLILTEVLF